MADNEQKNYFEFIDIPDGNGGTDRRYAKDAEAQAAIQIIEEEIQQLDPASVIEVSDVTALTSQQIESLLIGSRVNKSDSTGKHAYTVTYRSDTGICLTYTDAENVETVSYDKVDGTWTYNSTDIAPISRASQVSNKADKVSGATNNHFAALNSNGNLKDSGKSIDDIKPFATTSVCQDIISELT